MVEPGMYIETSDTKALQHTYEAPPSSNTYIQSVLKVISWAWYVCKNTPVNADIRFSSAESDAKASQHTYCPSLYGGNWYPLHYVLPHLPS